MAFNTGNTVPSSDAKDLSDNAENLDQAVNSRSDTWVDRLSVPRDTVTGRLKKMGYTVPISYAASISFGVNDNVKTVDEVGVVYAPLPSALPFTTSGTFIGDDDARFFVVQGVTNDQLIADISQAYEFANISAMTSSVIVLPAGKVLHVIDVNAEYIVTAGAAPDTANPALTVGLYAALQNGDNPYKYGAIGDGVADDTIPWGLWVAATLKTKTILIGSYLVSGVVKVYSAPTFISTIVTNHSAGDGALESDINGVNNTAFGWNALSKTTGNDPLASAEGNDNTAFGSEALKLNTLGNRSTAVGYKSCASNVGGLLFGNSLTAMGYQTLFNNVEGKDNTALGYHSMFFNEGGSGNTGIGYRSLWSNTGTTAGAPGYAAVDGSFNVAVGYESMLANNIGKSNTAVGWRSLFTNNIGFRNTCGGQESMRSNVNGNNNVSYGYHSLHGCVNGDDNSVIGYEALFTSTQPMRNVVMGREAMKVSTNATDCVALGYQAMIANVGGIDNVAIGYRALSRNTSGNDITAVGHQSLEFTVAGGSNLSFSNCSGLGSDSRISAANQVQLGNTLTTTYAYGAVQDRSDMRDKLDPKDLTDAHIAFFMAIEWKQYRMNYRESYLEVIDGELITHENDGSKAGSRYHVGAIAQQVEEAMKAHGIDFAGLQHHSISGGEDVYSIGYQEFIAIQGFIIQRQQARLLSIEERLTAAGL